MSKAGPSHLSLKARIETQNKTLVKQNSALFHLTSNVEGLRLVNCNSYLMKVSFKKLLVFGTDKNINDEVALQFEKEINIAAIHQITLPV